MSNGPGNSSLSVSLGPGGGPTEPDWPWRPGISLLIGLGAYGVRPANAASRS